MLVGGVVGFFGVVLYDSHTNTDVPGEMCILAIVLGAFIGAFIGAWMPKTAIGIVIAIGIVSYFIFFANDD